MNGDASNPTATALPSFTNATDRVRAVGGLDGFDLIAPNPLPDHAHAAMYEDDDDVPTATIASLAGENVTSCVLSINPKEPGSLNCVPNPLPDHAQTLGTCAFVTATADALGLNFIRVAPTDGNVAGSAYLAPHPVDKLKGNAIKKLAYCIPITTLSLEGVMSIEYDSFNDVVNGSVYLAPKNDPDQYQALAFTLSSPTANTAPGVPDGNELAVIPN